MTKEQRKRSDDEDMEKYNQIVVADEEETEHEYKNEYRGKVQNRKVEMDFLPMYEMAFAQHHSEVKTYIPFDRKVDAFNAAHRHLRPLYVVCSHTGPDERQSKAYFDYIDSLSARLAHVGNEEMAVLLFQRAVAYSVTQNLEEAVSDLGACLQNDSTNVLVLWQRAVCNQRLAVFNQSQGKDSQWLFAHALSDLSTAIMQDPQNAYLLYDRGNMYASRKDYGRAIEDYTRAIIIDQHLAEAYYNRGMARLELGRTQEGIADLSKAGELGLYQAYSVIKRHRK